MLWLCWATDFGSGDTEFGGLENLGLPILNLGTQTLGVYILKELENLGLPILDLGAQTLGVYILGV